MLSLGSALAVLVAEGLGWRRVGKKNEVEHGSWAADIATTNQKAFVPRKWLTYSVRRGGLSSYYGGRGARVPVAAALRSERLRVYRLLLGRLLLELEHFPGWWLLHIFYTFQFCFGEGRFEPGGVRRRLGLSVSCPQMTGFWGDPALSEDPVANRFGSLSRILVPPSSTF